MARSKVNIAFPCAPENAFDKSERRRSRTRFWLLLVLLAPTTDSKSLAFRGHYNRWTTTSTTPLQLRVRALTKEDSWIPSVSVFLKPQQEQRRHHAAGASSHTCLFGMKGFRGWLESQFPNAVTPLDPQTCAGERFDHVLVDVNQLLHVASRRSRNNNQSDALRQVLKSLDNCVALAMPRKSLVLALDGPPSAAKLATQRKRRYHIVASHAWRQQQTEFFQKRGIPMAVEEDDGTNRSSRKSRKEKKGEKKRKSAQELSVEALRLTPGTAFMDQVHDLLLFWAWQRLERRRPPLEGVAVYQSPSLVPGEGEVKLLDWLQSASQAGILQEGDSVAIVGGDSDLVLEGLLVRQTHNVVVLLPEGRTRCHAVSLWALTRQLASYLQPHESRVDWMRFKTDLVLLLILKGNDYLPKLLGCHGFEPLFFTYVGLVREWWSRNAEEDNYTMEPYLLRSDTLEFNSAFCREFFARLQDLFEANSFPLEVSPETDEKNTGGVGGVTTVMYLNTLMDCGFLPQPMVFTFSTVRDEETQKKRGQVRLTLGKEGRANFYEYSMIYNGNEMPRKEVKQKVADVALQGILGSDYRSFRARVLGDILSNSNQDDENLHDEECDSDEDGDDDEDSEEDGEEEEEEDGEEEENDDIASSPMEDLPSIGYDWELGAAAPYNVEAYLGGLLWNLQMYQEGVCPNYGYNYGRRKAPPASALSQYFSQHQTGVGQSTLFGNVKYVGPLNAGASCLAALPSQVRHLIPEPYQSLAASGEVESIYASCIDPHTNTFDMDLFRKICEELLQQLPPQETPPPSSSSSSSSRRLRSVRVDDSHWTVLRQTSTPLRQPFSPPQVNVTKLSTLRPTRFVEAKLVPASIHPSGTRARPLESSSWIDRLNRMGGRLEDIAYFQAFEKERRIAEKENSKKSKRSSDQLLQKLLFGNPRGAAPTVNWEKTAKDQAKTVEEGREMARLQEFLSSFEVANVEGQNALQVLHQLIDARLVIGSLEWDYQWPSESKFASIDPKEYEQVRLVFRQDGGDAVRNARVWEQDRSVRNMSRRRLQHYLSSLALQELLTETTTTSTEWNDLTFAEIRKCFEKETDANGDKNDKDIDAMAANHSFSTAVENRMRDYGWEIPALIPLKNLDGETPISVLHQLSDANVLKNVVWDYQWPSCSDFAKQEPTSADYEDVELRFDIVATKQTVTLRQDRHRLYMTRKRLQQHLAGVALQGLLLSDGNNNEECFGHRQWHFMTSKKLVQFVPRLLERLGAEGQESLPPFASSPNHKQGRSRSNKKAKEPKREESQQRTLSADPDYNVEGFTAMEILRHLVQAGVLGDVTYETQECESGKDGNGGDDDDGGSYETLRLLLTDVGEDEGSGPSMIYQNRRQQSLSCTRKRLKQEMSSWALQDLVPTWKEESIHDMQRSIGNGEKKTKRKQKAAAATTKVRSRMGRGVSVNNRTIAEKGGE